MNNKKLIIDGDLIAYRFAAAAEKRTVIVKHLSSGREKEFKTRTDFKDFLKKADREYVADDYSFTDIQTPEDVSHPLGAIKKLLNRFREFSGIEDVEIYLGTGKTFRHNLALPSAYKNNRDDMLKPIHLQAAREYMINVWGAKLIEKIEVDDVVTIRSYEELQKGNPAVLISVDKDSYQSQGITLLNWLNEEWKLEEIPIVGHLRKEKSAVKGNGLKFLAYQVLAGDNADTYCGYELSDVKYGPVKAMNALIDAESEQEIINILVSEYRKLYPKPVTYTDCHGVEHTKDYMELLQLYWEVAYMKRDWNDPSDFKAFCSMKGLSL